MLSACVAPIPRQHIFVGAASRDAHVRRSVFGMASLGRLRHVLSRIHPRQTQNHGRAALVFITLSLKP